MTREEVKKVLVDVYGKSNLEELKDNTSRIIIKTEVLTRAFYFESECVVFMSYIKTENAIMSNLITATFHYSDIKRIDRTHKGV